MSTQSDSPPASLNQKKNQKKISQYSLLVIFAFEDFSGIKHHLGSNPCATDALNIVWCVVINLQAGWGIHVEPLLHKISSMLTLSFTYSPSVEHDGKLE